MTTDRTQVLLSHGLTNQEATVYLALLEYSSLNASALARLTKVSRNRIYEVLDGLQEKGLVEVHLDEPRRYRAQHLSNYLERRRHRLEQEIEEIETQKERLESVFQVPAPDEGRGPQFGEFRVLTGRRSVAQEIERLLADATREIAMSVSPGSLERALRHVLGLQERIEPKVEDGSLRLEILVPPNARRPESLRELPAFLDRCLQPVDIPFNTFKVVVDQARFLIVQPIPDDGRLRSGQDFAIFSTNPAFIADHLALHRCAVRQTPADVR